MGILTVEVLLPEQTVYDHKHSPFQRLALAIAERAVRDLGNPLLARDAERWLSGELKTGISFELVMDLLEIHETKMADLLKIDPKSLGHPGYMRYGSMSITAKRTHEAYGNDPFVD